MRVSGWMAFASWSVVGALYGLVYLGVLSIGIFVLPVAIVASVIAWRRLRIWPEMVGFALGPAFVLMRIGSLQTGLRRCGPAEQAYVEFTGSGSGSAVSGTFTAATGVDGCIDMNLPLLMWSGITLAAATLVFYAAARYRIVTGRRSL